MPVPPQITIDKTQTKPNLQMQIVHGRNEADGFGFWSFDFVCNLVLEYL
jgi:hypothetical protein